MVGKHKLYIVHDDQYILVGECAPEDLQIKVIGTVVESYPVISGDIVIAGCANFELRQEEKPSKHQYRELMQDMYNKKNKGKKRRK